MLSAATFSVLIIPVWWKQGTSYEQTIQVPTSQNRFKRRRDQVRTCFLRSRYKKYTCVCELPFTVIMPRLVVILFICSSLYPSVFTYFNLGEDLLDLVKNRVCLTGYFQCDGKCVSATKFCDGYPDCNDNSDEKECDDDSADLPSSAFTCAADEYKCRNNKCIPAGMFCDGSKNCLDGSDEYNGCVDSPHLNCSNKFRCHDKHCVPKDWVCDGSKDCPDGSDELNCSANKTSSASDCKIENSQYLCENQRCISLNVVCNKKNDCGDGSDEGAGCTSSNCTSAKCDHICKHTPRGNACICKPGYKLQNDNHTCIDIDECQTYGICDQNCTNSPGSYTCTCQNDYLLQNDKKTCKALAGEATMVFSTKTTIVGMYLDTKISFNLATNLNRAVSVAMNGDHIYWSDVKEDSETIVRKITQKNHEDIVTTGLSMISGIAVDWITENIYFTDEGYNRIGVCNNNGTYCTILISGNFKPTGIAILPTHGKMYWSDCDSNPYIAVAGMDGKKISTLVYKNLKWPSSITIDYPNDRLYWMDAKLKIIESTRLDGTDRRLVLPGIIHGISSLAVFENKIYWSESESNTIQSCNKFSGKDWNILTRMFNHKSNVHIDHSAIKPKINNPCRSNPCSQLCMLNQNQGYTCACTLDNELNADNHTCREVKQHLLLVGDFAFINYYHGLLGKPKMTSITSSLMFISEIMSDPLSGEVIICQKKPWWPGRMNIRRYDPVKSSSKIIMSIDTTVGGVAFDHIGNNLYVSNLLNKSIDVYNLRTLAMTAFYFQDYAHSITLVPEESKMFVSFTKRELNEREYHGNFSIYEMKMNGLGERKLLTEKLHGPKISMDYDRDSKILFISDKNAGIISSYSTRGIRILRTGLKLPVSLAVAGDNIFWTESDSKALYWTNFKNISYANHKGVACRLSKYIKLPGSNLPLVVTLRKDVKQEHGCQKNNGNCSHVCLLSSVTSFICACPPGMELSNDNRTCILPHECKKGEYKCSEHNICIKMNQWCNGYKDCPNGEDETRDCERKWKHCKEDQFMCKNGECISSKKRCNWNYDCTDQSDEKDCKKPKCKSDEFQCGDGTCIPSSKVCDSFPDCFDYSDESNKNCISHTCASNQFMCDNRKCIPKTFLCDGDFDCTDRTDEEKCKLDEKPCKDGHFRCTNGNCISSSLKCNGIDDCSDGSDERHCIKKHLVNCTQDQYHCFNTELCIPKKQRCNGVRDCPRNDDEDNCAFCLEHQFTCDNTICILEESVCDRFDDCGDNSDEKNCNGNRKDINESNKCDEFKCSVGTCLPYSKVCDGTRDCPDGSDEDGKCQIACAMDNYCRGICYKTPKGAVCGCQNGYRLAANMISCDDINECEQDVCSQICRNTMGSYECSCYDGYIIRSDKVSCKAVGPPMKLITATNTDIRKISPHLDSIELMYSLAGLTISGLDVNAAHNSIYWSNDEFGVIKKLNGETKKITEIMIAGYPQTLAVDWITDNVYVNDNSHPNTIKVCNVEKQRCATLVKIEDVAKTMALIVDPINRWLFWAEITWKMNQPSSKICRADMEGADIKIINVHVGLVNGMAIDYIKSKLYWSDSFHQIIESSNLDGNQRSTFLKTDMYHPLSISIYEQSLYWLTGSNGNLQSCKLYGKELCEKLDVGVNNIQKLFTILHISRQPFVKNPCDEEYCDYMCVLKKDNAICICSDGKPIKSNSTCTTNMNSEMKFAKSIEASRNTRNISGIYSITLIVLLVGVLLLCVYYYYQRNKLKSKPVNDLSSSSIRFQNPSYERRDEVEVVLNSGVSDLSPGQHEYVNPIDDKFLKIAMESSAQKSDQRSEENNVEETEKQNALIYFTHLK